MGEETEAIILKIDIEKQKLSLGIKQLEGDIWEDFFVRQKIGDLVKVKIVRLANFGVFVEITPGIEGVIFLSAQDQLQPRPPVPADGLDTSRLLRLQTPEVRERLAAFLGRPVSMASLNR